MLFFPVGKCGVVFSLPDPLLDIVRAPPDPYPWLTDNRAKKFAFSFLGYRLAACHVGLAGDRFLLPERESGVERGRRTSGHLSV
ncbi:hypothetical protein DTO164E3_1739 [Paecilomyces variotii]|nr:hypothetical protein DTO164E3_1739 [Paecilomyces variotii]KAJ9207713.1 hypothetical protein DTO032I3_1357 [Paecilomyces variotii]KAJ9279950.1 hypothetical protein DTO021D3_3178 [Paecilomyces variotii]KAJ9283474.1 hypothetical protein DTO021C3_8933 [Paecilomyces variotii]KAJ9342986.1 hypothetical protein DTO027B6_4573 [Paecilomyces variotii]